MRCIGWMVVFDTQLKYRRVDSFFSFRFRTFCYVDAIKSNCVRLSKKVRLCTLDMCDSTHLSSSSCLQNIIIIIYSAFFQHYYYCVLPQLFQFECFNMHICKRFNSMRFSATQNDSILCKKHAHCNNASLIYKFG